MQAPPVRRVKIMHELLFKLEKFASGGLLAVLSVTIFVQVISRYFLNLPLAWSEEVSRYSFIWLTMIAAPICIRTKANLNMDVFARHLSRKAKLLLEILSGVFIVVLLAVMLVWGLDILNVVKAQSSPAIGIPMYWVYAAIPVGAALMIVEVLALLYASLRKPLITESHDQ